jgi:hypothetical protein
LSGALTARCRPLLGPGALWFCMLGGLMVWSSVRPSWWSSGRSARIVAAAKVVDKGWAAVSHFDSFE